MARLRSSASKTRARRSQCPGPEFGSGAVQAGGLRKMSPPWGPHGIPFTVTRVEGTTTGSGSGTPTMTAGNPGDKPGDRRYAARVRSVRFPPAVKEYGMKLGRTVVAAVLAAVVLSACSAAEKISPQVAMRNAANTTVKDKQGTFTFSLVGSEDDLNAVLNEGATLSEDDRLGLRLLGQSHITLITAPDSFALDVKVGDIDHAVELRYVGKKLYVRADVPALVKLMGGSADEVNQTVQSLAEHGFGFLKDAAAGTWIVADFGPLGDMLKGFAEQFGG